MIVEWHNHVLNRSELGDPRWEGRCPMTIENVLKGQDEFGIELSVVSNSVHPLRGLSRRQGLEFIKEWNDYAAELQERHKGRIVCFSSTAPGEGPEYMKELERALDQLKLKGVYINSSHKGGYPDDDEALPFWEIVTARDVPVMMHPPHVGFGEERMKEYRLASSIGRPFDSCLAIGRLIVRGIFERFPALKLVATHLGGGICDVIGRMDYAYELQQEAWFLGRYEPMLIKRKPSHYLKRMYLDLVCYHLPAAKCALETMGVEHVLYGSDSPPLMPLKERAIQLVRDLPVSEAEREKIFSGNALKLLKTGTQPAAQ